MTRTRVVQNERPETLAKLSRHRNPWRHRGVGSAGHARRFGNRPRPGAGNAVPPGRSGPVRARGVWRLREALADGGRARGGAGALWRGQHVRELAVLCGWACRADAVALADSEVPPIDGTAFQSTLVRSPGGMFALPGVLSRCLQNATDLLVDGASLRGPARLAKALCRLAGSYGRPDVAGLLLDVSLSQRELGGMTGLSRESISKQLASWRDCGWIRLAPHHIVFRAVRALREVVDDAAAA